MVRFNYLDFEMAFLGAFGMAVSIFVINLTGGWLAALKAAGAQAVYSFFMIGFTNNLCRTCAVRSYFQGVIVPTFTATILTYIVHTIVRSPQPFWSAAFAFAIALPSFALMSSRYRTTQAALVQIVKNLLFKRPATISKPKK